MASHFEKHILNFIDI